jgi:hypothetical protein
VWESFLSLFVNAYMPLEELQAHTNKLRAPIKPVLAAREDRERERERKG